MAISASSSNFTVNSATGSTTVTLTVPTSVPAGATLVVGVLNRSDETTAVSSVAGSLNASGWTLASGPTDLSGASTGRMWTYYKVNSAAGSEVVTVTFGASINSQIVGGWFEDASHGAMTFDTVATPANVGTGTTDADSNTLAAAGAGAILGILFCGNIQTTLTADGAGESRVSTVTGLSGQQRIFAFFEAYASAGTVGFVTTPGTSTSYMFHVAAFNEPSAGTAVPVFAHHLRQQGIS
jgi:hypothetical protein